MNNANLTIFALSSGQGRAGVAVVRVSGPGAAAAVTAIAGSMPAPRRASLRRLRAPETGETLDRALVLWLPSPASFTAEDMAEFHVHGGRAVLAGLLEALGRFPGFRPATPGEFSRRAFEAGKLDLTEAEGLADLIDAETEAQRRQALRQASGAARLLYDGWRAEIIRAMAAIETALDFSDEADVPEAAHAAALPVAEALEAAITRHLADGRRGEILRDGLHVVIAGPPNAGKSSLLNALAGRDAAIVSHEPGTTRDVIDVRLDLGGYPLILSDTAGIREAPGVVEREGVRRAMASASEADIVLWLTEPEADLPPPTDLASRPETLLQALNKADLLPPGAAAAPTRMLISVKTGLGMDVLLEALRSAAASRLDTAEPAIITRARHRHELEAARDALRRFLASDWSETELRAEDLREAAFALGRITGRVDVEQVLDEIFARFCIGK